MAAPLSSVGHDRPRAVPEVNIDLHQLSQPATTQAFRLTSFVGHWRIMLTCVVLCAALGVGYALVRPERYTAHAVILVGGESDDKDAITARGDVELSDVTMLQLAARAARLDAEIQALPEIVFPPSLAQSADQPAVASLVEGERLIFAAGRRAMEESLEKLRQESALSEQRVAAIEEQVRLADVELSALNEELASVKALVEKKLVPASRLLDLQRTGAAIASRKVELQSELLSVRQSIAQTELRIVEVRNKRESDALDARQEVLAAAREAGARRQTASRIVSNSGADGRFDAGMIANEIDLIRSDALVGAVVRRLALDYALLEDRAQEADIWTQAKSLLSTQFGWSGDLQRGELTAEGRMAEASDIVQASLGAQHEGPGSKVAISYTASDPARASLVANTIAETYLVARSSTSDAMSGLDPESLLSTVENAPPSGQIIRTAQPPRGPDGPGPGKITVAAATLGLMLGTGLVILLELLRGARLERRAAGRAAKQF